MATRTRKPSPSTHPRAAGSVDSWRRRNVHTVTLPSGMVVVYRRVSLGWLITHDALPEELRELAVAEYLEPGAGFAQIADELDKLASDPTAEQVAATDETIGQIGARLAALNREIVAASLLEPAITAAELADPDFPEDDLQWLADLNTGRRHTDAAGRVIGVMPLSELASFRDHHGCAADCPDCTVAQQDHSTVDLGAL